MASVMMAMLLINTERINDNDGYPVLSCADIEQLLSRFFPQRDATKEEIILRLKKTNRHRQQAIESHARRRKKTPYHYCDAQKAKNISAYT